MTPVKYEHDIQWLTSVLAMVKNQEIIGMKEYVLVTPTHGVPQGPMSTRESFRQKSHFVSYIFMVSQIFLIVFQFDKELRFLLITWTMKIIFLQL